MKKKILITSGVLLIILAGAFFYLKYRKLDDFEPLLKKKLQETVAHASNGLYKLTVDKIDADIIGSKLVLINPKLTYDSIVYSQLLAAGKAPADVYEVSIHSLGIDGLSPADLIHKKDIRLNVLYIDDPAITVTHKKAKDSLPQKSDGSLYSKIEKTIGSFGIEKLVLKQAVFTYTDEVKKTTRRFSELTVDCTDLLIDSTTQYDTTRFFFAKDARIFLQPFSYATGDSLYYAKFDSLSIHAARRQAIVYNFKLQPRVSKAHFKNVVRWRKDRYDLAVRNIQLNDVDWWNCITGDGLEIGEVILSDGNAEIYSDKAIPARSEVRPYPHQSLFSTDYPVYVGTVSVKKLDITYSEYNVQSAREGQALFDNCNGTITNITNVPARIQQNASLKINASTNFMKATQLSATFIFDLARQKQGIFSVSGETGTIDGKALNKAIEPLALARVNSANVSKFSVQLNGNNNGATGKVLVVYKDLNISVLKKDDEGNLKKRGLISFIANSFKVHDEYPGKGKTAVPFDASFVRGDKTFFGVLWKTILEGVKKNIGI
jgi:hypothetical protein